MAAKPTRYNIPMDRAAIEVLFDQTSCKEQRQKGEACSRCIVYKLYIPKISCWSAGTFLKNRISCLRQAQLAPEEVQRKNAVGKRSITNLEHKAEDATEVFADVSRFSRPTVVPHGQKSLWEMVV